MAATIFAGRHAFCFPKGAVEGPERSKARINGNGQNGNLFLRRIGQGIAYFGQPVTVQERGEIAKAKLTIYQPAQAVFLLTDLRCERRNRQALGSVSPFVRHKRRQFFG